MSIEKQQTPQIPKIIKDFIFENREYFKFSFEISDIDICSACSETNTNELIIYDAVCILENGVYILEWKLSKDTAVLKLNGEILMNSKNPYNLNYKNIEI